MDSIDISTSDKGKTPASTSGVEAYNKEAFGDEIRRLTQANAQLAQNKQNSDAARIAIEVDKNRLISEKNALVVKHEELQGEIAALQRNLLPPFAEPLNQRIGEIASIPGQDKLKARIPDAFDRTKRTFRRFLIQIKIYHQFHIISLPYPNNKV